MGVVAGLLSPAAVDHEGDVVDGDGRLGDVGGQHDLPPFFTAHRRGGGREGGRGSTRGEGE